MGVGVVVVMKRTMMEWLVGWGMVVEGFGG